MTRPLRRHPQILKQLIPMSLSFQILGAAAEDNATLVTIDTGSSSHLLMFDCGEGCLNDLSISNIQSIEGLFFSHFHMDHVCGFDTFFRHNFNRPEGMVRVFGPPGTIDIMEHRFRAYNWNLHHGQAGKWKVTDAVVNSEDGTRKLNTATFLTSEAFAHRHDVELGIQLPRPI